VLRCTLSMRLAASRSTLYDGHDELVVLDLRKEETIYAVNRFMIYAMYPGNKHFNACHVGIKASEHGICDW